MKRHRKLCIVEIGYGEGKSIPFWQTLFPRAHVVCLDRDVSLKGEGFEVLQVDQADPAAVQAVVESIRLPVHLIVDDGSHFPPHQLSSLSILFDQLLRPGGIYIVEDVETSYWIQGDIYGYPTRFGLHNRCSAVEVLKLAVDYLMAMAQLSPATASMISTITFAQNCVILSKALETDHAYMEADCRFAQLTARP